MSDWSWLKNRCRCGHQAQNHLDTVGRCFNEGTEPFGLCPCRGFLLDILTIREDEW